MRRIVACLMILGFFNATSIAKARSGENGTSSNEDAKQPTVKSDNSTKTDALGNERDAVESEMQELRDLVQPQTDELRELRARLAVVEAEKTPPKEPPIPPAAIHPSPPAVARNIEP